MERSQSYIILSLELHLFFARIMKEHVLFLAAGFTPVNASFAKEANLFKSQFEELLTQAVRLGDGIVRAKTLCSGEIVTEFTAKTEQQTQQFTGIAIDQRITALEENMRSGEICRVTPALLEQVRFLNQTAIRLTHGLIHLKERILDGVTSCCIFTTNYPLLIQHIIREAKLYCTYLTDLESGRPVDDMRMRQTEQFWNRIMMEHALFIRGLLDPCEEALIRAANDYAEDYARLLETSHARCDFTCPQPGGSLAETIKFRDFKSAGTKGICCCEIQSVILPLLADHVLREANHYIRLLSD